MEMRNVHEYDGKIPMTLEYPYTKQEEDIIFNNADNVFLKNTNYTAKTMVSMIMTENDEKNIDKLNLNMNARKMLIVLFDKISNIKDNDDRHTYYQLLEEQLCDMKRLGSCPQGRTIRLWQLLQTLL